MPSPPLLALALHFLAHNEKKKDASSHDNGNFATEELAHFPAFSQRATFSQVCRHSHTAALTNDTTTPACYGCLDWTVRSLILLLSPLVLEISARLTCALISHLSRQLVQTSVQPPALFLIKLSAVRGKRSHPRSVCVVEAQLGRINCFGGSARCGHGLALMGSVAVANGGQDTRPDPCSAAAVRPVVVKRQPPPALRAVFPWRWA